MQELKDLPTQIRQSRWLVACLCAAWCDTCNAYRTQFDELAKKHPDKCFAWIDIEDDAHLVDEVEIENFPTLLIQVDSNVEFLGTMLPDTVQLHRLLSSIASELQPDQIRSYKRSSLNQSAPDHWNLKQLILDQE
ncbi:thioredoxin family protein [Undibacterium rugosum]|uniref:Thioredoxin family protein n=1 Tax=Undibacterium rugosum TaxID=2762291 RepID=A0A923I3P0_9BURK|nr:thioredoxin family protein [Undibacterium rugosum]MBC3936542.1 thioredoxin family protein [Undibacterium rugosum]MBR7778031.1 thioredoxin family protein [Undibacterium rugosum]